MQKLGEARFGRNYQRILKSYYLRLRDQAVDERERVAANLLRKRMNRNTLSSEIITLLSEEEESEDFLRRMQETKLYKEDINNWLSRLPREQQSVEIGKFIPQHKDLGTNLNNDNGDDDLGDTLTDYNEEDDAEEEEIEETLGFTEIEQIEAFLRRGEAFNTLVRSLLMLQLPGYLREMTQTVPKKFIQLSPENDHSKINRVKLRVEEYTAYRWDWWPLRPPLRDTEPNNVRVQWKVSLINAEN